MILKFIRDWGEWKAGQVTDQNSQGLTISDTLGNMLIQSGDAQQSNEGELTRSVMLSQAKQTHEAMLELTRTTLQGSRTAPVQRSTQGPPNGGGGVDFTRIANGESPVDHDNKKAVGKFSEALRAIAIVGKPHQFDPALVAHTHKRLQAMSTEATEYRFNDNTGTFDSTVTRQLEGGGVETITRTGTDSLSGGTTYGFALKPEYLGSLFEISMEQQVFANAAQNIPVSSGLEVKWPAWDQYTAPVTVGGILQPAVFTGITLSYAGETTARTASDANLDMINFKVVDLTGFTALSRDFVVDNYLAFDAALTRMFGRAIGWMEDYMSIQGAGGGKPQGYFNAGATQVVQRTTTVKIVPADLTAMIALISPMVWDDLRWITNITCFPQLSILNDGTSYVFQPNALISQAMKLSLQDKSVGGRGAELMHRPMGDLLGFPVYFSEKVPVLNGTGDLSLVAPSQYGIARRAGLEMGVSEHFYFDTDRVAYRFKIRHDMKSLWRAPYQQADGSKTKVSPFVLLGAK